MAKKLDINLFRAAGGEKISTGNKLSPTSLLIILIIVVTIGVIGGNVYLFFNNAAIALEIQKTQDEIYTRQANISALNSQYERTMVLKSQVAAAGGIEAYLDTVDHFYQGLSEAELNYLDEIIFELINDGTTVDVHLAELASSQGVETLSPYVTSVSYYQGSTVTYVVTGPNLVITLTTAQSAATVMLNELNKLSYIRSGETVDASNVVTTIDNSMSTFVITCPLKSLFERVYDVMEGVCSSSPSSVRSVAFYTIDSIGFDESTGKVSVSLYVQEDVSYWSVTEAFNSGFFTLANKTLQNPEVINTTINGHNVAVRNITLTLNIEEVG